jgi:hypothetical protein
MGNIIGDPFDKFVKSQIEVRQKALGELSNISADNLKYFTTKTPWLRLASSVDLKGEEGDGSVLDKLIKVGVPEEIIRDSALAKNFILQGGAVSLEETTNDKQEVISSKAKLQKGLNYSGDIFNGAYGWGGLNEQSGGRGYVPMPGIESAQTTYYNNGALSKATIKIKCFSKAQFQLLDVLYLRPGYTLLLEFGWTAYLSSKEGEIGELRTYEGFKSQPLSFLLKPGNFEGDKNQFKMFELMQLERIKHSGNYEAVYGKISNFKWSFSADGSYECTVTLVGMGSILESLKLNVASPKKEVSQPTDSTVNYFNKSFKQWLTDVIWCGDKIYAEFPVIGGDGKYDGWWDEKKIQSLVSKTNQICGTVPQHEGAGLASFKKLFKTKYEEVKTDYNKETAELEVINNNNNALIGNKDDTVLNKIYYEAYQTMSDLKRRTSGISTNNGGYSDDAYKSSNRAGNDGGLFGYYYGTANSCFMLDYTRYGERRVNGEKLTDSVYLKFGTILEILQDNCNLFSEQGEDKKTPMIKYDFQLGDGMASDENYMTIVPPSISCDPSICLVSWQDAVLGNDVDFGVKLPINKTLLSKQNFIVEDNRYVGRIANVLINLRFAATVLADAPRNDDGAISVLSYIQSMLEGINKAMGSINNFKVAYDEVTGLIKIWDETPKHGLVSIDNTEFATLNVFGVRKDMGSFVTNIGLDAEIPKNLATMISIGAQVKGSNLQGNATSFTDYSKGLVDRVIPVSLDAYTLENGEEEKEITIDTIKKEKIFFPTTEKDSSPLGQMYGLGDKEGGANQFTYDFTPENVNNLTENYIQYIQLMQGELAGRKFIQPPFFLPFNLNLEMEGLSGMKLFQKFRITDDVLPPSYGKDSIDIIVKAINHDIDVKEWRTTIDTQSVTRSEIVEDPFDSKPEQTTPTAVDEGEIAVADSTEENNEDNLLRLRLTRLVDNGVQTLGLMEVLNETGQTLYALPTCELPWRNNESNASCIPVGTYNVSGRLAGKYQPVFMISEGNNKKEFLASGFSATGYNTANREWVLIHAAASAQQNSKPWLLGCIAPGFKFNTYETDRNINFKGTQGNGNPRGIGPQYSGLSKKESNEAVKKLHGTLWNVAKPSVSTMFKLEIKTLGGVNKPIDQDFYNFGVQAEIRRIEKKTGETYQFTSQDTKPFNPNDIKPTLMNL